VVPSMSEQSQKERSQAPQSQTRGVPFVTPDRAEAVAGDLGFFALGETPALVLPVAAPDLAADRRDLPVDSMPLLNHPGSADSVTPLTNWAGSRADALGAWSKRQNRMARKMPLGEGQHRREILVGRRRLTGEGQ